MSEEIKLWEILVPTLRDNGRFYSLKFHRVWDKKIESIAGGLSIIKPMIGVWTNPDTKETIRERVIPVRIACTRAQIELILDFTIKYYDQHTCLAYKISDEVIFKSK